MSTLMNKILSKNIIECIKQDIDWFGESIIEERYRIMCKVKTLNNEFEIVFDRSECKYNSFLDRGYSFLCTMSFINPLGIEVLKLTFSEADAFVILDNIIQFEEFNGKDWIINLSSTSADGNRYFFKLDRINTTTVLFTVYQYNPIYNISIPRLSFQLSINLMMDDFLYCMYFSYVIDLDIGDGTYLSMLEYIAQRIVDYDIM